MFGNAEQTAALVELLKTPPAGEEDTLVELLTQRVAPGVDDAAYVKAAFLSAIAKGKANSPLIDKRHAVELLGTMLGGYNVETLVGLLDDTDIREIGVPLAERKVKVQPDRMSGYWLLAQMYLGEKDWDGVLGVTERALGRMPDEETMMPLKGRALREKGDLERAAQHLARAIGAKPSFAGARIDLGKLFEQQGKIELAEEVFREIPVANPDYAPGPMSLALFLGRQERFEEAEKVFLATWPSVPPWFRGSLKQNPDAKAILERPAIKELVEAEE